MVNRQRGFTLIEILVALTILASALLAMVGLWYVCFGQTAESADIGSAYSIARQEIEKAKGIGTGTEFWALPDRALTESYYDRNGQPLATETGAHYWAETEVKTFDDSGTQPYSFNAKRETVELRDPNDLDPTKHPTTADLRLVTVMVYPWEQRHKLAADRKPMFATETYLVLKGF